MSFSMNFINLSGTEFVCRTSFREEPGLKTHSKVPQRILAPHKGNETLSVMQEQLSWYVDGHDEASVCYYPTADGGESYDMTNGFGLKVHEPLQFLGMGKRPRWSAGQYLNETFKLGGFTATRTGWFWEDMHDDDVARTYTFEGLSGYAVEISPTSTHGDLKLVAHIRNVEA